jgi:hypothetical protein
MIKDHRFFILELIGHGIRRSRREPGESTRSHRDAFLFSEFANLGSCRCPDTPFHDLDLRFTTAHLDPKFRSQIHHLALGRQDSEPLLWFFETRLQIAALQANPLVVD